MRNVPRAEKFNLSGSLVQCLRYTEGANIDDLRSPRTLNPRHSWSICSSLELWAIGGMEIGLDITTRMSISAKAPKLTLEMRTISVRTPSVPTLRLRR